MAVKAHRIVIEPTSIRGERGQYYHVYFEGAVLIEDTWNPEFEARRALIARGITGCLETGRVGKTHRDMIVHDLVVAARYTVEENDKRGPLIVPWRPWVAPTQPDADVSLEGRAPAAEFDRRVG